MVADFKIDALALHDGMLGICQMPGRTGHYAADLETILHWAPDSVLTMTMGQELAKYGAGTLGTDLSLADIAWHHLPVPDFRAPPPATTALWPEVSQTVHKLLKSGGRVLAHCHGGCGRSGMVLLRLMVEAGEVAEHAIYRLRLARPCAIEHMSQFNWAASGNR